MGDSPERDFCDVVVSFFNTIHFKLLKISRVIGEPVSDTRTNFLTDSPKLNLWASLTSDIAFYRGSNMIFIFRGNFYWYFLVWTRPEFGYHFSWNWIWCVNMPWLREKLSQVTFPHKVVTNNHSVTIEGNLIWLNVARGSLKTLAYHSLSKFWMQKYRNLGT